MNFFRFRFIEGISHEPPWIDYEIDKLDSKPLIYSELLSIFENHIRYLWLTDDLPTHVRSWGVDFYYEEK